MTGFGFVLLVTGAIVGIGGPFLSGGKHGDLHTDTCGCGDREAK